MTKTGKLANHMLDIFAGIRIRFTAWKISNSCSVSLSGPDRSLTDFERNRASTSRFWELPRHSIKPELLAADTLLATAHSTKSARLSRASSVYARVHMDVAFSLVFDERLEVLAEDQEGRPAQRTASKFFFISTFIRKSFLNGFRVVGSIEWLQSEFAVRAA